MGLFLKFESFLNFYWLILFCFSFFLFVCFFCAFFWTAVNGISTWHAAALQFPAGGQGGRMGDNGVGKSQETALSPPPSPPS